MNSTAMSEFVLHNVTYGKHCEIQFRAVGSHNLVVAKGMVDGVAVEERAEGVHETATGESRAEE